jgi:hypothetical protein
MIKKPALPEKHRKLVLRAEYKKLWLDGMLSGEYVQGKYTMRSPDGSFCPLGVLADVSGKGHWDMTRERMFALYNGNPDTDEALIKVKGYAFIYSDGESQLNQGIQHLPKNFARLVGLTSDDQDMITNANDNVGQTFAEIASWIKDFL